MVQYAFLNPYRKFLMRTIPFHKMVASGNDFVVFDNRKQWVKSPKAFAAEVCAWHTGIGADGVLLFEKSRKADFKMRIINADGSEAEACGNGFRCIARYAHEVLKMPSSLKFESLSGMVQASVKKETVIVELPAPRDLRLNNELTVNGNRLHYSFINTGVPHTVIFVEGLPKVDVTGLGRAIRNHPDFKPRGTNVNFVEVQGGRKINVRTYERGVENETLACGTGSTASAIISSMMGYVGTPVRVKTSGGEILTIHFNRSAGKISRVMLEGAAHFVFEGKLIGVS